MKVLYIAHFKEGTGWSEAAMNYVLAMDSVDIDVVIRNVKLTSTDHQLPFRLVQLEKKSSQGCDICIQHLLPHHLIGTGHFKKNIAFFVSETTTIKHLMWFKSLQQMDEIWVPNKQLKSFLVKDGIDIPINIFPHAFAVQKYKNIEKVHRFQGSANFKFYYVGDINDRKNIDSIIRCFHSEFDKSEPVSLVLKVNKFGLSSQQVYEAITSRCDRIKKELRMYPTPEDYHKEIISPERLSENALYQLHENCDCFVSPSHGEAWSIPAFEAMAMGKTPICSNFGGPPEFIDPQDINTGVVVDGNYGVCNCSDSAFKELFTGRESWFEPSENEIKKRMRFYYENKDKISQSDKRTSGFKQAEKFSHEIIGQSIKEYLWEK